MTTKKQKHNWIENIDRHSPAFVVHEFCEHCGLNRTTYNHAKSPDRYYERNNYTVYGNRQIKCNPVNPQ